MNQSQINWTLFSTHRFGHNG